MNEYILLMHDDAANDAEDRASQWPAYFAKLRQAKAFDGGSSIGGGVCVSKGKASEITRHLAGYIRILATDLDQARALVIGNPVYEAGGTVEIRELPRD